MIDHYISSVRHRILTFKYALVAEDLESRAFANMLNESEK